MNCNEFSTNGMLAAAQYRRPQTLALAYAPKLCSAYEAALTRVQVFLVSFFDSSYTSLAALAPFTDTPA